jgi:hypothetical protein
LTVIATSQTVASDLTTSIPSASGNKKNYFLIKNFLDAKKSTSEILALFNK